MNEPVTKADVDAEDWEACLKYPLCEVECYAGHVFHAHSKFSGRLVAIISHTPCPKCGAYQLRRVSSNPERQVLTASTTGKIDDV